MIIGGERRPAASGAVDEITSPWDGRVVGTVPRAGPADAEAAVAAAAEGAVWWRRTPAHERLRILLRAADLVDERTASIAALISAENGKSIREATVEASRCGDVIRMSAFEGAHLYGESLPLDAAPGTGFDKIGFTVRQPCGVVLAITPFNYPGLLAIHKIAPALAAGNAVVLKPAELTPLTALALADCFLEANLPGLVLSVVTGHGSEIGDALVAAPRVRKVSFTGSTAVGERISRTAGVKKLSLELGSSAPVVILPDADLEVAATAVAAGGYANAGQVCISVQRVITHPAVTGDFLDALVPRVKAIRTGDPAAQETTMGTLISEGEAVRVQRMIDDAAASGARVLVGGSREGAVVAPAVVADVDPASPLHQEELFGPAVAVSSAADWETAIAQANGTPYGLSAGVFTGDVAGADTRDPRDRRGQRPHQLDAAVARRSHALRRPQGQRDRQGGPAPGGGGDDGGEDRRPARPSVVTG